MAQPAPVQELGYAFFRMVAPESPHIAATLPWLRQLEAQRPDWFLQARAQFGGHNWTGYEALLMACALGYALDEAPERFLQDVASLPRAMAHNLTTLNIGGQPRQPAATTPQGKLRTRLQGNYELLASAAVAATLARSLRELWAFLQPDWQQAGHQEAELATQRLLQQAELTGDLLQALPPHHFVSLESSVADIRLRGQQVRLVVAPLYFAAMGGFKFEIGSGLYLGYGINSEVYFKQRQEHVESLAARFKAVADPTRLMLLVLISRLRRFPLTVGDLARQLGVSQPTASGHLRLLRQLGLVEVVKRGNRSYYRVREASLEEMLQNLEETLLLGRPPLDDG